MWRLLLLLLLRGSATEDSKAHYTLVAVSKACSNNFKAVSSEVGSAQECADLVCMDSQCGSSFEHSTGSSRCSCLEAGQTCLELDEVGSNRYEITDNSACEPRTTDNCFATLYSEGYFAGWAASFTTGAYSGDDIVAAGGADNDASSVFVSGEGCTATLYGEPDFSGWSVHLEEGSYSLDELLAKGLVDDDTSAVRVEHMGHGAAVPAKSSGVAAPTPKARRSPAPQPSPNPRPSKPRRATTTPAPVVLECDPITLERCSQWEKSFIGKCVKRNPNRESDRYEEEILQLKLDRNFQLPKDRPTIDHKVEILRVLMEHMRAEEAARGVPKDDL